MSYSTQLAAARNTTKQVKGVLAGLLVTVKTNASMGSVLVMGHCDELIRAQAKLESNGFKLLNSLSDNCIWVGRA